MTDNEGQAPPDTGGDSRPSRRKRGWFPLAGMVLLLYAAILPVLAMLDYALSPMQPGGGEEILVSIPAGSSIKTIGCVLAGHGVVAADFRFRLLARLLDKAGRLKAGEYAFSPGLTPVEILRMLEKGAVAPKRVVTLPEGYSLDQIARVVAAQGLATVEEFLALTRDREVIASFALDADTLEGYLFPDTYFFYRGMKARDMVRTMVERFFEVYAQVEKEAGEAAVPGLSRHQRVTLASIVEKETADPRERPLIARVFLNRLRRGMRLQTDPTVIYGIAAFNGNLTRKDLEAWTPYNTYLIDGLPPGPIASPGREALAAVFLPAVSNSLFFVSKNDGTHYFSSTLEEHNRAVRKYQKTAKQQ